jgi:chromosome partitioning protein
MEVRLHTLVIASQKGGSGKTTLSGHLAVEAERAGAGPVALVDTDPQGSLSEWWNERKATAPAFVKVGSLDIEAALAKLADAGIKLAIVDTPPAITGAISYVVACADLVVVPTRPSPHDLRAVGATVDIAEHHGKNVVFVINDATARARITAEAAVALSQHGTVAPVTIHNRVDFAASMIDGRTVGEVTPQSKSAEEISKLWKYITDRLSRTQTPVRVHAAPTPSVLLPPQPDDELFDSEALARNLFTYAAAPRPPTAADVLVPTLAPAPPEAPAAVAPATVAVAEVPQADAPPLADRRSGNDRREWQGRAVFAGADRRSAHPFGRRSTDRAPAEKAPAPAPAEKA